LKLGFAIVYFGTPILKHKIAQSPVSTKFVGYSLANLIPHLSSLLQKKKLVRPQPFPKSPLQSL
jgi:hypothetical protein